jgi:hypothetical protein
MGASEKDEEEAIRAIPNPRPEDRRPKETRRPRSELIATPAEQQPIESGHSRDSGFGLLSGFGPRSSDFRAASLNWPDFSAALPARGASGIGNWDQPRHATCSGWPIRKSPTYSAFWSVFGVTCLRLQRLGAAMGFGTTARLAPRKNLPYSGVTTESVVSYATPAE